MDMTFANNLKQLRKDRGLTQPELAKDLGLSPATIAMYETGKRYPSYEKLKQIADYFQESFSKLFDSIKNEKKLTVCDYYDYGKKLSVLDENVRLPILMAINTAYKQKAKSNE